MIFDKSTYATSGLLKSFKKRISLALLKNKVPKVFKDNVKVKYPTVSGSIDTSHLSELNELCHVSAFVAHNKKVFVKRYICDSCGDCTFTTRFNIEMSEDSDDEELLLVTR